MLPMANISSSSMASVRTLLKTCCGWWSHRSLIPAFPIMSVSIAHTWGPKWDGLAQYIQWCRRLQRPPSDASVETAIILVQFVQDADARHVPSLRSWRHCLSVCCCGDWAQTIGLIAINRTLGIHMVLRHATLGIRCAACLSVCLSPVGLPHTPHSELMSRIPSVEGLGTLDAHTWSTCALIAVHMDHQGRRCHRYWLPLNQHRSTKSDQADLVYSGLVMVQYQYQDQFELC